MAVATSAEIGEDRRPFLLQTVTAMSEASRKGGDVCDVRDGDRVGGSDATYESTENARRYIIRALS